MPNGTGRWFGPCGPCSCSDTPSGTCESCRLALIGRTATITMNGVSNTATFAHPTVPNFYVPIGSTINWTGPVQSGPLAQGINANEINWAASPIGTVPVPGTEYQKASTNDPGATYVSFEYCFSSLNIGCDIQTGEIYIGAQFVLFSTGFYFVPPPPPKPWTVHNFGVPGIQRAEFLYDGVFAGCESYELTPSGQGFEPPNLTGTMTVTFN